MSNTISILVVDDQETVRIFMTRILNSLGYACDTATNGQECLDLCETRSYDLVFLDLVMPILDGEVCLQELAKKHPTTDVVIISVNDDEESVANLLHAGATAYLCKPFKEDNVRNVVKKIELRKQEIG